MHVGVFLSLSYQVKYCRRLPHACGGVSIDIDKKDLTIKSSPCMWGCFPLWFHKQNLMQVFPMHVGVFLYCRQQQAMAERLPHACGGVSMTLTELYIYGLSSPCMWGCF